MRHLPLLWLLVLLISPSLTAAQTDDDSGWPVIERCVGEPTTPSEDWRFEGTILMTGYAGIHGVNAEWETPHIVARQEWYGINVNLPGAALSSNGRWYATPWGDIVLTETYNVIYEPREIRVYDTSDEQTVYTIDLEDDLVIYGGGYDQIFWQDDEHLLYFDQLINPFTEETEHRKPVFLKSSERHDQQVRSHPSPNLELVVNPEYSVDEEKWVWNIYDPNAETLLAELPLAEFSAITWRSDSQRFAAEIEANAGRQLAILDTSGRVTDVVFQIPMGQRVGKSNLVWSPDSRYLAFILFSNEYGDTYYVNWLSDNQLYIVDTLEEQIVNTCLRTGIGLAWSPDVEGQLAFLAPGEGLRRVFILDANDMSLHAVANHIITQTGVGVGRWPQGIIGWRAD